MADERTEQTTASDRPQVASADVPTVAQFDAPAPVVPLPTAGRYTLHEAIARGGMGVVYRATDGRLGREVAVKVLGESHGATTGAAHRFIDEARITGQLQHPGIPAVHDLGVLPDGRPFLAMKLVKGRTLEALLRERSSPAEERGRFLAVFEAICQAVGYAHAHNVVHRDLKPANVMVGAFGEVQVMDWGLAKVLHEASGGREPPVQAAALTEIRSGRDSGGSETQAGSVLGTPAFMPPEQAIGAVDRIDARSDVFGLGGLLLVILTGRPPFVADSAEATRQLAARARLGEAFAALDACGADPDLMALCKRCLSAEPEDRPADAGAVARAVADLRAAADERARQAELERVRVEAEVREQRHRRRVYLALLAALGLLVCGFGVVVWWRSEQARDLRERQGRNAEATAALLERCAEALHTGNAAGATHHLEAARARAAEGGAEGLASRIEDHQADLVVLRELDRIDQISWAPVDNRWLDAADLVRRYRAALEPFGADAESAEPDAVAGRVARSAIRDRLVAVFDAWLVWEKSPRVRAVLRALDPHPFRDSLRDATLAGDDVRVAELAGRAEAAEQPPGFVAALAGNLAVPAERLRQLLEAAVQRRPADLGLLMAVGNLYPVNWRAAAAERLRWYQAAVAASPLTPAAHNGLGIALLDVGDRPGAVAAFREALRLDPKFAHAHTNLGWALQKQGRLEEAVAELEEARRLDPGLVLAHDNLGWTLLRLGRLTEAAAAYRAALGVDPMDRIATFHLAEIERFRKLLPRLADIAAGRAEPATAQEAVDFATLCGQPFQKRYTAAVRLSEAAFRRDPALRDDLVAGYRYNAACYAALGAADATLPPAEQAALRGKALAWLRDDLTATRKQAASDDPDQRREAALNLDLWFKDPDLATVGASADRTGWPEAEGAAWDALWADALVARARAIRTAPKPAPRKEAP